MKKTIFTMVTVLALVGCGSQKTVATPQSQSPFGEVYEAPCTVYDTPEEFAATGIYRGSMNQKGLVQKHALQNAQSIVRMKMQHAYKGMVSDFSQSVGSNQGNDLSAKISQAGDQIIDVVVNTTNACCIRWGAVGEDGHIECYVAIKISKEDLSKKVAEAVDNKLTEEEKLRIGFDEAQYREKMEQRFKEYKEQ